MSRSTPITQQPRATSKLGTINKVVVNPKLDDEICERSWSTGLCACRQDDRCVSRTLCWPYFKYTMGIRLGESPFVPLLPCAMFAFRVKVRTLFSIKGSIVEDFCAALCCEPCIVCQMSRELDKVGL